MFQNARLGFFVPVVSAVPKHSAECRARLCPPRHFRITAEGKMAAAVVVVSVPATLATPAAKSPTSSPPTISQQPRDGQFATDMGQVSPFFKAWPFTGSQFPDRIGDIFSQKCNFAKKNTEMEREIRLT